MSYVLLRQFFGHKMSPTKTKKILSCFDSKLVAAYKKFSGYRHHTIRIVHLETIGQADLLPKGPLKMLKALANFANKEGSTYVGHDTLAKFMGCTIQTSFNRQRQLKELGLLEIAKVPKKDGTDSRKNLFAIVDVKLWLLEKEAKRVLKKREADKKHGIRKPKPVVVESPAELPQNFDIELPQNFDSELPENFDTNSINPNGLIQDLSFNNASYEAQTFSITVRPEPGFPHIEKPTDKPTAKQRQAAGDENLRHMAYLAEQAEKKHRAKLQYSGAVKRNQIVRGERYNDAQQKELDAAAEVRRPVIQQGLAIHQQALLAEDLLRQWSYDHAINIDHEIIETLYSYPVSNPMAKILLSKYQTWRTTECFQKVPCLWPGC